MSDAVPATPVAPATAADTPKGKGKKASASKATKKPKVVPSHPPTAQMVNKAIADLKEKGGSSLSAIKKYVGSTYKVDAQKLAPFIRKYLVSAVTAGKLVQTKGKGASGSFKLATKEKVPAVAAAKKEKAPKKKAPAKAKKPAAAKKSKTAAAKKPAAPKKPKTPTKAKASKPTKKAAKSPAKKAPKPKKIATKKAAPKKK